MLKLPLHRFSLIKIILHSINSLLNNILIYFYPYYKSLNPEEKKNRRRQTFISSVHNFIILRTRHEDELLHRIIDSWQKLKLKSSKPHTWKCRDKYKTPFICAVANLFCFKICYTLKRENSGSNHLLCTNLNLIKYTHHQYYWLLFEIKYLFASSACAV